MSCEGCISSARAMQVALDSVKQQAKKFALENSVNVFLYYDSDGSVKFISEEAGRLAHIQPTAGIVTPYKSW